MILREKSTRYLTVLDLANTHYYFKYEGIANSSKEYWELKNSIPKEAQNIRFDSYSSNIVIIEYDILENRSK